jgi:hypothetical protein
MPVDLEKKRAYNKIYRATHKEEIKSYRDSRREKQRDYKKKWNLENAEKTNTYNRDWKKNHPERATATRKRSYEKNRDKELLYAKNHRLAHPEEYSMRYKKYYEINKEKEIERKKEWRKSHAKSVRKYYLRIKYDITLDDYEEMLISQNNSCKICGSISPNRKNVKYFHIDHDHKTGEIRGLLCHECNTGIGKLKDDPTLLRKAASYLSSSNLEFDGSGI